MSNGPSPKLINLPRSPRVEIFRLMDTVLRNDPVFSASIRTFKSWEGYPGDKTPSGTTDLPFCRLNPRLSGERWWANVGQEGELVVDVELVLRGTCWDDLDNLWYALERSFYPFDLDQRNAIQKRFREAGAPYGRSHKPLVEFRQPAFDPQMGEDDRISAVGQIVMGFRVEFWS